MPEIVSIVYFDPNLICRVSKFSYLTLVNVDSDSRMFAILLLYYSIINIENINFNDLANYYKTGQG